MYIIGGRDYYDNATPYRDDKSRPFKRDRLSLMDEKDFIKLDFPLEGWFKFIDRWYPTKEKYQFFDSSDGSVSGPEGATYHFGSMNIIFAGIRYVGIRVRKTFKPVPDEFGTWTSREELDYIWDEKSFRDMMAYLNIGIQSKKKSRYTQWVYDSYIFDEDLEAYFKPKELSPEVYDILMEKGVVVAKLMKQVDRHLTHLWATNFYGLDAYSFAHAVPPMVAYQEIDMYLGNMLTRNSDKMVTISDLSKRDKYGFDTRSFKNTHHQGKPRGATL